MAGGMYGGVHGRGHVGGMHGGGVAGKTAIAAGSMHPTGM